MRVFSVFCSMLLMASAALADRPIFLVTPSGVYQSIVDSTGKPGAWTPIAADVIVQGFPTGGPNTPIPPDPPSTDPVVQQIAALSKATLKDKDEATAVGAIVDSISKLNLPEADFRQSMELAAPVVDTSLSANGRIKDWVTKALAITADPAKLKAGLASSFGVAQATLDSIHGAATNPGSVATGESVNWATIISIIQAILALLKQLGIGVPA